MHDAGPRTPVLQGGKCSLAQTIPKPPAMTRRWETEVYVGMNVATMSMQNSADGLSLAVRRCFFPAIGNLVKIYASLTVCAT